VRACASAFRKREHISEELVVDHPENLTVNRNGRLHLDAIEHQERGGVGEGELAVICPIFGPLTGVEKVELVQRVGDSTSLLQVSQQVAWDRCRDGDRCRGGGPFAIEVSGAAPDDVIVMEAFPMGSHIQPQEKCQAPQAAHGHVALNAGVHGDLFGRCAVWSMTDFVGKLKLRVVRGIMPLDWGCAWAGVLGLRCIHGTAVYEGIDYAVGTAASTPRRYHRHC
jgi:hypothetical protein